MAGRVLSGSGLDVDLLGIDNEAKEDGDIHDGSGDELKTGEAPEK